MLGKVKYFGYSIFCFVLQLGFWGSFDEFFLSSSSLCHYKATASGLSLATKRSSELTSFYIWWSLGTCHQCLSSVAALLSILWRLQLLARQRADALGGHHSLLWKHRLGDKKKEKKASVQIVSSLPVPHGSPLSGPEHSCCALQLWGAESFFKAGTGNWESFVGFPCHTCVCVLLSAKCWLLLLHLCSPRACCMWMRKGIPTFSLADPVWLMFRRLVWVSRHPEHMYGDPRVPFREESGAAQEGSWSVLGWASAKGVGRKECCSRAGLGIAAGATEHGKPAYLPKPAARETVCWKQPKRLCMKLRKS